MGTFDGTTLEPARALRDPDLEEAIPSAVSGPQRRFEPACLVCGTTLRGGLRQGPRTCPRCGLRHWASGLPGAWRVTGAELGRSGCRRDRRALRTLEGEAA